jgi:chromosome segregation ATPase
LIVRIFSSGLLAIVLGGACSAPVLGQAARNGGDGARADNARALQQMQQLAAERTALQADNARLNDAVAELKRRLDKAVAELATAAARVKELDVAVGRGAQSSQQTSEALEKSRAQMQELITRFRATAQDLKAVETDRNALRGQQEILQREYANCVERNVGLYQVGHEALDRLERHGFFSKLGESEPFTQIARARLENAIDDDRRRLDELRVEQSKRDVAGKAQ